MGSGTVPKTGKGIGTGTVAVEEEVWAVEICEAAGNKGNLEIFALAVGESLKQSKKRVSMKLVNVMSTVPCGIGASLPQSQVDRKIIKAHEIRMFKQLVTPLLQSSAAKKVPPKYIPARSDKREEGLMDVAHKIRAVRFYVPVKKSSTKLIENLVLTMPGGCTVIGVCGGKKLIELTAEKVDVFCSQDDATDDAVSVGASRRMDDIDFYDASGATEGAENLHDPGNLPPLSSSASLASVSLRLPPTLQPLPSVTSDTLSEDSASLSSLSWGSLPALQNNPQAVQSSSLLSQQPNRSLDRAMSSIERKSAPLQGGGSASSRLDGLRSVSSSSLPLTEGSSFKMSLSGYSPITRLAILEGDEAAISTNATSQGELENSFLGCSIEEDIAVVRSCEAPIERRGASIERQSGQGQGFSAPLTSASKGRRPKGHKKTNFADGDEEQQAVAATGEGEEISQEKGARASPNVKKKKDFARSDAHPGKLTEVQTIRRGEGGVEDEWDLKLRAKERSPLPSKFSFPFGPSIPRSSTMQDSKQRPTKEKLQNGDLVRSSSVEAAKPNHAMVRK